MSEHTEQYKGLTIELHHDQDCPSPLEGDCEPKIGYRAGARTVLGDTPLDAGGMAEVEAGIASGKLIGHPVFAYVHSGVALNTTGFSCPWDSGQSGYIYIAADVVRRDWYGVKRLTAAHRIKALQSLNVTLAEFEQWLNGECYGYKILDTARNELDSCQGFIGRDYALQEARDMADHLAPCAAAQVRTTRAAEMASLRATNARLIAALQECVTDPGAACWKSRDYAERRIKYIDTTARVALK